MLCLRHRRIVLAINMDPKIFASVRLVHLESRSRHIIFFGLTGDAARSPSPGRARRKEYLKNIQSLDKLQIACH